MTGYDDDEMLQLVVDGSPVEGLEAGEEFNYTLISDL